MSDDRKDLPPTGAPNFNERLREVLSTYLGNRGSKLDRGVTLRDLVDSKLVTLRPGYLAGSGGTSSPVAGPGPAVNVADEPDLTPPPPPEGFAVSAAISNIFITHDGPTYTQGHGHAGTVVYGATWVAGTGTTPNPKPTFVDAVKITEFSGSIFSHPTNPATVWHLWIKWKSVDGVESASPAGGTNGQVAETGQDVTQLVEAMTGPGNPFTVLAEDTVIDGVTFPAGTYSTKAFIQDLQVTQAKIRSVKADSITTGVLQAVVSQTGAMFSGVNAYTMSAPDPLTGVVTATYTGQTPGTAGFGTGYYLGVLTGAPQLFVGSPTSHMLWNGLALTVRGTVYATTGLIGGITIASNALSAGQTAYNTGTGFFLAANGQMSVGSGGGNRLVWDGTNIEIVTPKLTVQGGNANFSGNLDAANITGATGTFGGTLRAGVVDLTTSLGSTVEYGAGTYTLTVPAGRTSLRVSLLGGGGGGGGGSSRAAWFTNTGGGGGGGGFATATYSGLTPGATYTLTVGSGGTAGAARDGPYSNGANGGAGGATTVAGLISAGGGGGGLVAQNANTGGASGGAGATAGETMDASRSPDSIPANGGAGGSSQLSKIVGQGGVGQTSTAATAGTRGTGGGGGGVNQSNNLAGMNPAAGGSGFAIIEFFDPNGVVLRTEFSALQSALTRQGIAVT